MPPFRFCTRSFPVKKSDVYEIPQEAIDTGEFGFGALYAASVAASVMPERHHPEQIDIVHGLGRSRSVRCLVLDREDFKLLKPAFSSIVDLAIDYAIRPREDFSPSPGTVEFAHAVSEILHRHREDATVKLASDESLATGE